VEQANQIFGKSGYNLTALATPARRIDPTKSPVHPEWAKLLDGTPKNQDKQTRELKQYANKVLDLDLKKIRVWVTQGPYGTPIPESAIDGERRTILHAHMIKSLKGAAHITEDVCDGDIATLFSKVVQSDQPEPRALLVDTLTRLSGHKKTENVSYFKWITELKSIFDTLRAVQFDMPEDFMIGYLLAGVSCDKRYADKVDRLTEKNRPYEECLVILRRRAEKLGDLKGGAPPAGVQLDSSKSELNLIQQTGPTRGRKGGTATAQTGPTGSTRGRKGGAEKAPTDKETIERLQKQILANKKATPCRQFAKGSCTRGDDCKFSHKEPNGRADKGQPGAIVPPPAKKPPAAKPGADKDKVQLPCFSWKASQQCTRGDTCKYQHELNMLMQKCEVPDPFSLNDTLLISEEVTRMGMVTGRVIKSFIVKRHDGTPERYYALDVPHAEIVHRDFKEMVASGIPCSYLTLYTKAPKSHEVLLLQSSRALNACLDGGATCCVVNNRRIIQPGTERKINITATLTDKSEMTFTEGGIINLKKLDGTVLSVLAVLNEDAERTLISKGLLKDLGYCEIDDAAHPDVTNLWLNGKLMFTFPRRTPVTKLTSTQATNAIQVSGLIEIPDHIFDIANPRQEFQLAEYTPVDLQDPTEGLHSLHELHHLLTAQNKTDKLGPIQTQNVITLHARLGHTDTNRCAYFTGPGIRLRDSLFFLAHAAWRFFFYFFFY
jgi:hypothetical protein